MTAKEVFRVFLSSPDDVFPERERAQAVLEKLSAEWPGTRFELVRWEGRAYSALSTFQAQIDKPSSCDLVTRLARQIGAAGEEQDPLEAGMGQQPISQRAGREGLASADGSAIRLVAHLACAGTELLQALIEVE